VNRHWCAMSKGEAEEKRLLGAWLTERVRYNDVPRMSDVMGHVKSEGWGLKKKGVREVLLEHPYFKMNVRQQRGAGRSRMYRPVIVSELGHWHADIGYFATNKRYEMPVRYRAGYLVAKDVLSRYVYAVPLIKDKSAESMMRALGQLLEAHRQHLPDVRVKSIAFDRETSMLSRKVQEYLSSENIRFHTFDMSSSKAKFAEGAIRLIREKVAVLMRRQNAKDRWWDLLPVVVENLNSQQIVVDGKKIGNFTPGTVRSDTVSAFVKLLHRKVPAYYYGQFDIAPSLVDFKYQVGTLVRAKLIATSSEVVGNKRSETNLTRQVFVIEEKVPYVTRNMKVGVAYKCREMDNPEHVEVFQEDEIALTSRHGDTEEDEMRTARMTDDDGGGERERPKRTRTEKRRFGIEM
jgi:hypothetical protein